MANRLPLFPTTLVGSYPQPEWLIDRKSSPGAFRRACVRRSCGVCRFRTSRKRRTTPPCWRSAQEEAGLDIITDGEIRASYSNRFATALEGIDIDNPGTALDRSGHPNPVPRIVGKIRRRHPVEVEDLVFLRKNTQAGEDDRARPFTMSQQAQNDYYKSEEEAAMDYAVAVNAEIKDLAAGADIVQVDEPYMQARPEKARQYGLKALNRALEGVTGTTAVHICFGYAAIIHQRPSGYSFLPELAGCRGPGVDRDRAVEPRYGGAREARGKEDHGRVHRSLRHDRRDTAEGGGAHQAALAHVPKENVIVAPDCGMKYLPRDVAFGKMKAMVEGAKILRAEFQ